MTSPSYAQLAGLSAWVAAVMTVVGMAALPFVASLVFQVWLGYELVSGRLVIPVWNA